MNYKYLRKRSAVCVLLVLFLLCSCRLGGPNCSPEAYPENINENKSLAEPLIAAVKAYYEDYEAWPSDLEVLVPDYLSEIPETVESEPFEYWTGELHYEYSVCFPMCKGKLKGSCCYLGDSDFWDCSYSGEASKGIW